MTLPQEKMARVIVNTDAKNEADDQSCIVHALLTITSRPSITRHAVAR